MNPPIGYKPPADTCLHEQDNTCADIPNILFCLADDASYPRARVGHQGFHEKFPRGEKPNTDWIAPSDIDPDAAME